MKEKPGASGLIFCGRGNSAELELDVLDVQEPHSRQRESQA